MVSEDSLDKKKQYNQQKLELHEKENLYNKLKDTLILIKKENKSEIGGLD